MSFILDKAKNLLLRRLLGHVMHIIYLAVDALKAICSTSDWEVLTTEGRRARKWHYAINEALRPWIYLWFCLSEKTSHQKIHSAWHNSYVKGDVSKEHVVYMRLNVTNDDIYIGKTSDYTRRYKEHTRMLVKHINKNCPECRECRKYNAQARIPFTRWITIPLATCGNSVEALSLEKWWIKRFKPNLNKHFTPPWVKKRIMDRINVSRCGRPTRIVRLHPRFDQSGNNSFQNTPISFTSYIDEDGSIWRDARRPFHISLQLDTSFTLKVTPGLVDITNWRTLRKKYPFSLVRINGESPCVLREFFSHSYKQHFQLTITPRKAFVSDVPIPNLIGQYLSDKGLWCPKDPHELADLLPSLDDKDLSTVWEFRNWYAQILRKEGRSQIWKECMRRYKGFTCVPIHIRLPRDINLDSPLFKESIRNLMIKHSNWPSFLIEWHIRNMKI